MTRTPIELRRDRILERRITRRPQTAHRTPFRCQKAPEHWGACQRLSSATTSCRPVSVSSRGTALPVGLRREFRAWWESRRLVPLPARSEIMARYLVELAEVVGFPRRAGACSGGPGTLGAGHTAPSDDPRFVDALVAGRGLRDAPVVASSDLPLPQRQCQHGRWQRPSYT